MERREGTGTFTSKPTLALIAHDRKKAALSEFALEHRNILSRFHLVATEGTGSVIRKDTRLPVHLLLHGPVGGDLQMGQLAAENEVQAVLFFRDPEAAPHEPGFSDVLRLCEERDILLATNAATAQAVLYFLENSPERGVVVASAWGLERPAVGYR